MGSGSVLLAAAIGVLLAGKAMAANHIILNEDNSVLQVAEDSLNTLIRANDYLLVLYTTSWCSSCEYIEQEFLAVSRMAKVSNLQLPFLQVDCDENEDLARSYPMITLIINRIAVIYEGKPTSESIYYWLDRKIFNPVEKIDEYRQFAALKQEKRKIILFKGDIDHFDFKVFKQVAKLTEESVAFAITSNPAVTKLIVDSLKLPAANRNSKIEIFAVMHHHSRPYTLSTNQITLETLQNFVTYTKNTFFTPFESIDSVDRVFNRPGSSFIYFTTDTSYNNYAFMIQLTKTYFGAVQFFVADLLNGLGRELANYLELDLNIKRQYIIIHSSGDVYERYKLANRNDLPCIENFIKRFLTGRLNTDNKMIHDSDIFLELGKRHQVNYMNSSLIFFNFHYRLLDCTHGTHCEKDKRSFVELAKYFHYVPVIQFVLVDHDFLDQASQTTTKVHKNSLPFVSYFDRYRRQTVALPDFPQGVLQMSEYLLLKFNVTADLNVYLKHPDINQLKSSQLFVK